ncbi:MAG: DUF4190 domain-containing protein [Carbonactinosporaceae bacterium]
MSTPTGPEGGDDRDRPPEAPPPGYYPPPPTYPPPARARNGMGTAALVLAILALLVSWFLGAGILLGVLGLIFGFIGLGRLRRGDASNQGVTVAGLVLSGLAILISIGFLVVEIYVVTLVNDCISQGFDARSEIEQCVRDRVQQ